MTFGLTPRQADALAYIRQYHAEKGRVPTYRALAAAMGWASHEHAYRVVLALIARGHLLRSNRCYRLVHRRAPSEPLQHGYVFIPVHELPQSNGVAA